MILERFENLCKEHGKSPSYVASVAGYDKSAITNWRKQAASNNGICSITSSRLRIIAEYLETTSDYLLGLTDEKRRFVSSSELLNNPRKMLLLDEAEGMTDKSFEQVIRMIRLIKEMQDE